MKKTMRDVVKSRFEVLDERFRLTNGDEWTRRLHTGCRWTEGPVSHDGVHCFDPHATLLGKLHLPEVASNLTFGGPKRNDLFITASSSLYTLRVNFAAPRNATPKEVAPQS